MQFLFAPVSFASCILNDRPHYKAAHSGDLVSESASLLTNVFGNRKTPKLLTKVGRHQCFGLSTLAAE